MTIPVPNLTDSKLDEAKSKLEDLGFDSVHVEDAIEERSIWMDSNWVVVGQDPNPGGPPSPKDAPITLRVAKPDDDKFLEVAPAASRYAAERRGREQQERREQTQTANREGRAYVNSVDPAARIGKSAIDELVRFANAAEAGAESEAAVVSYTTTFNETMREYTSFLEGSDVPGHLEGEVETLLLSIEGFKRSSQTLGSCRRSRNSPRVSVK